MATVCFCLGSTMSQLPSLTHNMDLCNQVLGSVVTSAYIYTHTVNGTVGDTNSAESHRE